MTTEARSKRARAVLRFREWSLGRAAIGPRQRVVDGKGILHPAVLGYLAFILFAACPSALYGKTSHSSAPRSYDVRPEVRIPVAELGYVPPGEGPAFYHNALISLHFIDANHLLFVFNTKGLLVRDHNCSTSDSQRMVRAVVLDLPSGKVEKQVNWELYDLSDFLWGLGNGEFLLQRCSMLDIVGASLIARPFLETSGAIEEIIFSPDRSIMVVETKSPGLESSSQKGNTSGQSEAQASGADGSTTPEIEADFVRIHPRAVFARGRLPLAGDLPMVNQGILETLVAPHNRWIINLHSFQGAEKKIATVQSFCLPRVTPLTNSIFVAGVCATKGSKVFEAYDLTGASLWKIPLAANQHYPRFLLIQGGAQFALESLHATQPLAALDPLSSAVIDAEMIDIYDTRTGMHIGSFATTPVYTGGKNVDFSSDGQRMAVLHNGAIEIYTLNELVKNHSDLSK